jgi:hypothetical protein
MMNQHLCSKGFGVRGLLIVLAVIVCFSTLALGANNITGVVRNQSRGEPSIGDEVLLVRLDGGMQEARAKTDARGVFNLEAQHPDKPYLVRVFHQGVSYDQRASPGQTLSIEVFDAAAHVRGIAGTIEILRTGTNGKLLHVSDLVEIKNASNPPLTQVGERTFEVYLPRKAKIDSVLAAGPGKIGAMISAASVPGEPGHFTVNFPLQPGATKFAFNYDLPYDGHAAFQSRHAYPLQQFAVMIPPTMKFSSRSPAFQILATGNSRYQVQAANQLKAGAGPEFEVSGSGALSQLGDQDQTRAQSQIPPHFSPRLPAPTRASSHSLAAIDPWLKQAQPSSQSFVLVGLTAALVAACVLLVWHGRKARSFSAAQKIAPRTRQRQRPAA